MADQTITYTISLTVKRAIRTEEDCTAEGMASREAQRDLEKEVLKCLRRLDGDCDCEVMETNVEDE